MGRLAVLAMVMVSSCCCHAVVDLVRALDLLRYRQSLWIPMPLLGHCGAAVPHHAGADQQLEISSYAAPTRRTKPLTPNDSKFDRERVTGC